MWAFRGTMVVRSVRRGCFCVILLLQWSHRLLYSPGSSRPLSCNDGTEVSRGLGHSTFLFYRGDEFRELGDLQDRLFIRVIIWFHGSVRL